MKKFLIGIGISLLVIVISSDSYAMRLGAFEVRPFLELTERYSDNVFHTRSDTESDFSTVISPGIEVVYPRVKRRYHLELYYRADIERFSRLASENAVSHTAKGEFKHKFPARFEITVSDELTRTHDVRGTNVGEELDFYRDNFFTLSGAYALTDRLRLQLDYSNYIVDYDASRNDFRDRTDNLLAAYLFYRFRPKTSAFIQYEYLVIDFRESGDFDSKEHHFYAGVTWEVTGKTKGTVKAGYEIKDFDDPAIGGFKGYIWELRVDHDFSARHSIKLAATRRTEETNIAGSDFFVSTTVSAEYLRKLTSKIAGRAEAGYGRDAFEGEPSRKDTYWRAGLGLLYQMKKWLRFSLGYRYTNRDSTIDAFEYTENTYYFRITAIL